MPIRLVVRNVAMERRGTGSLGGLNEVSDGRDVEHRGSFTGLCLQIPRAVCGC